MAIDYTKYGFKDKAAYDAEVARKKSAGIALTNPELQKQASGSSSSAPSSSSSGTKKATQTTIILPDGRRSTGFLIDGKTYLDADGKTRLPAGAQVQTGSGQWWTMGSDGVGVKTAQAPMINPQLPLTPDLLNAQDLARQFGITFDAEKIRAIFQEAAEKEAALLERDLKRQEEAIYKAGARTQGTYLGGLREAAMNAPQTGAMRGMQAAQELSALLGSAGTMADNTTEIGRMVADLAANKAAGLATANQNALNYSNSVGQALGSLAGNIQASGVQQLAAQLAYEQGMDANAVQRLLGQLNLEGTKYSADQNLKGTQAAANAQVSAAGRSASAAIEAARLASQQQPYNANSAYLQELIQFLGPDAVKSMFGVETAAPAVTNKSLSEKLLGLFEKSALPGGVSIPSLQPGLQNSPFWTAPKK